MSGLGRIALAVFLVFSPLAWAGGDAGATLHTITMKMGHVFAPEVTRVRPGDTIMFVNKDKDLHALTLQGHEDLLDEEYVDPGKRFHFVVPADAQPGDWVLNCYIHVDMQAKIVIEPAQ